MDCVALKPTSKLNKVYKNVAAKDLIRSPVIMYGRKKDIMVWNITITRNVGHCPT